jgi:hypothetical protein
MKTPAIHEGGLQEEVHGLPPQGAGGELQEAE